MEFGKESTFHYIQEKIRDADDTAMYEKLCYNVAQDARSILRNWHISKEDMEDIIQDVTISVFRRLTDFCVSSKYNTDAQRNAWLRKIVENKARDFLRKQNGNPTISLDDENCMEAVSAINIDCQISLRAELYDAIKRLGEMRTSPDKAMAFLLNKLDAASSEKNGKPRHIAEELHGAELVDVFNTVKIRVAVFLGESVPNEVFAPLWKKVAPVAHDVFSMTPRKITDSSNEISEKFRKEINQGGRQSV